MRASFPANSPVAIPDTTMPEADLLQACLDELDGVDDFLDRRELAEKHAPVLLGRPGIASMLAARIARTADSERNAPLDLFGVLVERAQRDAENRRRFGEPFLAEARGAIDTLAARGDLPDHAALGLARAFIRAGLEAPQCLFPIFAGEPGTGQALAAFPGLLDREIDRLARHAGGDDHLLHDLLANLMAVLPSEFRPTFVHHVSGREEERYGRAALYWLLDRSPEVRLAAASGLSGRVRGDAMEPALPALVPLIRNWMPADSARPLLDTALREARLRSLFHPMARPAGRPARFLAALPAGSGMQHLAAALDPADGPACAVVVVKAGHGVTIARIFRDNEALSAASNLEDELGALDVPFQAFETALSAAIADGLAEGRPPPARLIDVAAAFGLSELRPRAMTARDWLAELDPGGAIADLPDGERDGLIRRSTAWPDDRPVMDTWFEGTALLDESLKAADGPLPLPAALPYALPSRIAARHFTPTPLPPLSPPFGGSPSPRPRNRLGADAPSPLLARSPYIDHAKYRRRLIALRAISPSRARRFALWRSERIASRFRSRRLSRGLRRLASRQLALVEERLEAPFPDLDASCFQHFVHLRHRDALGPLLDHAVSQTVQDVLQAQLRRRQLRQVAVNALKVDIRLVETPCGHCVSSLLRPLHLVCRMIARPPHGVNGRPVRPLRWSPTRRDLSLSLRWNPWHARCLPCQNHGT